jgi:hypothetical protein
MQSVYTAVVKAGRVSGKAHTTKKISWTRTAKYLLANWTARRRERRHLALSRLRSATPQYGHYTYLNTAAVIYDVCTICCVCYGTEIRSFRPFSRARPISNRWTTREEGIYLSCEGTSRRFHHGLGVDAVSWIGRPKRPGGLETAIPITSTSIIISVHVFGSPVFADPPTSLSRW